MSEPAEGNKRSRFRALLEPEMIVAIAAVVIGVCALVVSLLEVRIMRDGQYASVWPHLLVGKSRSTGESFEVVVLNSGIGPAIIRNVDVKVRGEVQTNWRDAMEALVPELPVAPTVSSAINGRIVSPREMISTWRYEHPVYADSLDAGIADLEVEVCYCSIYEVCWITEGAFGDVPLGQTREVPACPTPRESLFTD